MPKKSEIAKHWREKIFEIGLFMDWGEPACWSCGAYDSENDIIDPKTPFNEIFLVWDKQKYLERCHVVPKGLGGCNCPGNIVLLCKKCHRENPDTDNPSLFLKWMLKRESFGTRRFQELKTTFAEFDLEINTLNFFVFAYSETFLNFVEKKSIAVRGKYTDSTRVSCLLEWLELYNTQELIEQLPIEMQSYVSKRTLE